MAASTATVKPVKGLVFKHATRTDWQGQPKTYTVTCVRGGVVHYVDDLRLKAKCREAHFPKVVAEVVREPKEKEPVSAPRLTPAECAALHAKAHAAGRAAGEAATPTPMVVVQRENPLDDTSPVVKTYAPVADGLCGFAWIRIRPGNSSYARWAKKTLGAHSGYYGGTEIWVDGFGQSVARKEAYARAYAEVLQAAGISAYPDSRLD